MIPLCRKKNFLLYVIGMIYSLIGTSKSYARDHDINYFENNYLTFELGKNTPVAGTQDRYESRYTTLIFGYRHCLMQEWMMGLSANLKSLKETTSNNDLTFLTLSHEAVKIFRVYHPDYILVGPKFMYLFPMDKPHLPLVKHPDIATEVGFAMSVSYVHQIDSNAFFQARVDRWRGTKTNKFHGIEVALGLGLAI